MLLDFATVGRLADYAKFLGLGAKCGGLESFGGETAFEKFANCRSPARHPFSEAEIIQDRKLFA